MSHPVLRRFFQCGLILIGFYAHASGTISTLVCEQNKKKAIKRCQDKIAGTSSSEKAKTDAFGTKCEADPNTRDCALGFGKLGASAKQAITGSIAECEKAKKDCDTGCDPAQALDNSPIGGMNHEPQVAAKKKECNHSIDGLIKKLNSELATAGEAHQGGQKTADDSTGQGKNQPGQQQPASTQSPQGQPPLPQQQSPPPAAQAPQAPQAPQTAQPAAKETKPAADPCQGANANLFPQCKSVIADKCKSQSPGAVGFGQVDPECAAATPSVASTTCARFQQQCAKDAAGCLKSMSAADRAKIQSECLSSNTVKKDEPIRQGAAGFAPTSVGPGVSSGGSGGGTSAGSSEGATLDDLGKLKSLADGTGQREGTGDNLRVDAAGGYSSDAGGDSGSSSESSFALNGGSPASASRSIAAQQIGPSAANATDVTDRYGPSVFSIQSSILRERCTKGRLLHCQPNLK